MVRVLPRTIPDLTEKQWKVVEDLGKKITPEKIEKQRKEAAAFLKTLKHDDSCLNH